MLISDKAGFRARNIIRDKEEHYIMIKKSILQEDIKFLNVYAANKSVNICEAKADRSTRRNRSIVILGDFNTLLSVTDRLSRQKISKDIVELNRSINLLDLIDSYRLFQPTIGYTFFSSSHGTFTKNGPKTYHNKFEIAEIIQCLLSDHNGIKLEINNRKVAGKTENT